MKFQLGRKASDVFVTVYIGGTLLARFLLEPQLKGHYLVSLGIGVFALVFLWALAKSRLINPSWFGLLKSRS